MTQYSVKVASVPLQARNDILQFTLLKMSFVPHPLCDSTKYFIHNTKMTHLSNHIKFVSLHGFKAELLTFKTVSAVTFCPQ